VIALVLVIMMEVIVIALRPATLTLRVYINVMIGHEVMHLLLRVVGLWLVRLVELFVYTVQRFVFCVLSLSYVEEF
jgi:F0F1-type ATP synthase membrane subunit a